MFVSRGARFFRRLGLAATLFHTAGLFAGAREYVVSPTGNDTAPGTWSQPYATIQKGLDMAQPGDTVTLRGGTYAFTGWNSNTRGEISARFVRSGEPGSPITLRGSPGEKAVIDGAEALADWQACRADLLRCGEIPDYSSVFVTNFSTSVQVTRLELYQGDSRLPMAQDPEPTSAFYWEDPAPWRIIPSTEFTFPSNSTGTIVDPGVLTQTTVDFWKDAYTLIWSSNNNVYLRKIVRFDPFPVSRISFDTMGTSNGDIELGKDKYALWNHPLILDHPGECYVDEAAKKIYLWPLESLASVPARWGRRTYGIFLNLQSHIVVENLVIKGHSVAGVSNELTGPLTAVDQTVRHVEVTQCGAGITINKVTDALVENCFVNEVQGVGIYMGGLRNVARGNEVTESAETSIRFYGATDSRIEKNYVHDSHGQHANGITCYLGCDHVSILGNTVVRANNGLTFQSSSFLTIKDNVFVGGGYIIAGWGGLLANGEHPHDIVIENNTVIESENDASVYVNEDFIEVTARNNIIDGGGAVSGKSHNLYTAFTWNEEGAGLFGTEASPNEAALSAVQSSIETDLTKIFVDAAGGDYRLRPAGDLIGKPPVNPWTMGYDGGPVGAREVPPPPTPPSGDGQPPPRAYPVPWSPRDQPPYITLAGFTPGTKLSVYTTAGRQVKSLLAGDDGRCLWDGSDDNGRPVSSGLYLVTGDQRGRLKTLKIVVKK